MAPLQITWTPSDLPVDDKAKALIVKESHTISSKILGVSVNQFVVQDPMTLADFWKWFQETLVEVVNAELAVIQAQSMQFEQETRIQMYYLQQATMARMQTTMTCQGSLTETLRTLTILDKPEAMDWEWTPPAVPTPLLEQGFKQEVDAGKYTTVEEDDEREVGEFREGSALPPIPDNGQSQLPYPTASGPRGRASSFIASSGLPPPPPPRSPTHKRRAGFPSDSEPSDNDSKKRKESKGKGKKRNTADLMEEFLTRFLQQMPKHKETVEAPKPQPYKGDPEELERFLQQLENVWALEERKYRKDITKIRYAANLLQKNTTDKHRDPVKWYESYHPKIDLNAARRLPGQQHATLDPRWATWTTFSDSLRTFFATRVGREQAVTQWSELKHTNSIDDFLDSLNNLMWRTGYHEKIARDKLIRGLNREVGLAWAQTTHKPHSLGEQMALIRDIGHNLERFKLLTQSKEKTEDKRTEKSKSPSSSHKSKNKRKRGEDNSDFKSKDTELKGIPSEVVEERCKADTCLKCGTGTHKWYECWKEKPVTERVTIKKKKDGKERDSKKDKKEEVKISAVSGLEPDEHDGRIIELLESSDGEYELLK